MFPALLNQLMISLHNNGACDAMNLTDCGVERVSLAQSTSSFGGSLFALQIHAWFWQYIILRDGCNVYICEQQCAPMYRHFTKFARVKLCLRPSIAITNEREKERQKKTTTNKNRNIFILKCRL